MHPDHTYDMADAAKCAECYAHGDYCSVACAKQRIAELERNLALAISEREALCDQARAETLERCESIEFVQAAVDGSLVKRWPDVDINAMYEAFRAGWDAHREAIRALGDDAQ